MMAYGGMNDGYELTLSGLIRRRAVLISEINGMRDRLNRLLADLDTLDRAIRVFDPDIDFDELPERRVPPAHVAFRGELARFVIDFLRKSRKPATSRDIGFALMEARKLNTADARLHMMISNRAGAALLRLKRKGIVDSRRSDPTGRQGGLQVWWLVRPVHEEARAVTG